MTDENTKKAKTNANGVTAPVRPRKGSGGTWVSVKSRDGQIKRLAAKHKTAFSLLAKR